MSKPFTFVVHRHSDNDVLKLDGIAGCAIVMQSEYIPKMTDDDLESVKGLLNHMPVVSLRADNERQLAMLLAVLIATVRDTAPDAVAAAFSLAPMINASTPELQRELPPRGDEDGGD